MRNLIRLILRWATFFRSALVVSLMLSASSFAGNLLGGDEAMRELLPGIEYERETHLLTEAEKEVCHQLSGQKEVSALITRYVVKNETGIAGYAYLDRHRVRTLPQILTVALDAEGTLVGIKVLAFHEPAEYMARDGWLKQFPGKTVEDEIRMKKNIDGITGATLTSRAVTQCARRTMAVHKVLNDRNKK